MKPAEYYRAEVEFFPFSPERQEDFVVLEVGSLVAGVKNPKIIVDIDVTADFLGEKIPIKEYLDFRLHLVLKNSRMKPVICRKDGGGWVMPNCGGMTIFMEANFHLMDSQQLLMVNSIFMHELAHIEQRYRSRTSEYDFGRKVLGYWKPQYGFWAGSKKNEEEIRPRDEIYRNRLSQGEKAAFLLYLPGCFEDQFLIGPELVKIYWPELQTFRFAEEI